MSADQQLTAPRLRAMTKDQIILTYLALAERHRRKETVLQDVISERNRLRQQITLLTERTPTVNGGGA